MTKELVITEKISKKICQELMLGTPLVRIAKDKDMPSLTKIYKWIASTDTSRNRADFWIAKRLNDVPDSAWCQM